MAVPARLSPETCLVGPVPQGCIRYGVTPGQIPSRFNRAYLSLIRRFPAGLRTS